MFCDIANPGPGVDTGILTGNVTRGPLCPAEPCTISPERLASGYATRIIVLSGPGGDVIAEAVPDPITGYSFSLRPGTCVVEIRHQGIDRSPDLPEIVLLREGETVRLDIAIETGIR